MSLSYLLHYKKAWDLTTLKGTSVIMSCTTFHQRGQISNKIFLIREGYFYEIEIEKKKKTNFTAL